MKCYCFYKWPIRLLFLISCTMGLTAMTSPSVAAEVFFRGQVQDGINGVDGLAEVSSVAMSPDGGNLYAAGSSDNAVAVFSRNASTGALTFLQVLRDGVDGVDGLAGVSSVIVSPDGGNVYTASAVNDLFLGTMSVFSRNTTTGALTFVEVLKDGVGGVGGLEGLVGTRSVTVSPDGGHVYASGSVYDAEAAFPLAGGVAVFSRNMATGALSFVEVQKVDGLLATLFVTLSPDGANVYAAGINAPVGLVSVAVFSRDMTTGALTVVQVLNDGVGGVDGLAGVNSIAVSPDGGNVYTAAESDKAVAVFSRNAATGMLSFTQVQKEGAGGVSGLDYASSVTVSPDGSQVFAGGSSTSQFTLAPVVAVFSRNTNTGALVFMGGKEDAGLLGKRSLTMSPDGGHLYVSASQQGGLISLFGIYHSHYDLNVAVNGAAEVERAKWDANNDNKIGLEEVIQGLRVTAGLQP